MPKRRNTKPKPKAGVKVKKSAVRDKSLPWYRREIQIGRVKVVDLVMLTKHFSVMLDAGLSVPESLSVLAEQSTGRLKQVMDRVVGRVEGGEDLGAAMEREPKVFSTVYISAVKIGEGSGTLSENLKRLSDQMDKDYVLRRNIQSAMLYPIVVLSAALVIGLGVATFVLPQIVGVFRSLRVDLPVSTRALIFVAEVFGDYGLILAPAIIIGIVVAIWMTRRPFLRPLIHRITLKLPIIGSFVHLINRAQFCRTLGTLLESGTPIQESLEITSLVMGNFVYRKSAKEMLERIGEGADFSEIVSSYPDLYPVIIHRMIAVGERSGNLGKTLEYLAAFFEDRVMALSKNISSVIEPILLLVIGLVVGLVAISILTPIYSITGSLQI
ncbi:MAG: type II secretion system F family protein [bacterium]